MIRPYIDSNISVEKELGFEVLVNLIVEMNNKKATVSQGLDDDVLGLLDSHFSTVTSSRERTAALKNKIYFTMWKSGKNLNNWIAQTTPISMGAARTAADASPSGQYSKQISNNNPISRFVLQYQNSIGKDAIGIDATGVKIWSLILNYFHEGLKASNNMADALTKFSAFKRELSSNGDIIRAEFPAYSDSGKKLPLVQEFTIPNINWDKVGSDKFKQTLRLDSMRYNNIPEDVFVTISVLLSAATDNAKELILEKINAGPDLAGVYIYLLTTGVEFEDIADFMTTSAVTLVQNKAKKNLMLGQTTFNNLNSAIKYYLDGVPVTKYMGNKYANGVDSLFRDWVRINNISTEAKGIRDYLASFNSAKELEPILTRLRNFYKTKTIEEVEKKGRDDYDDDMELDAADFIMDEEQQQTNKVRKDGLTNVYLNRFFEDVYSRQLELDQISDIENFRVNIDTLSKVVESAKEINILGRLGSLNQGIRTKLIDKIKYELQIEKFVNKQISKMTNAGIDSILNEYAEKWSMSPRSIFNFETFAANPEYRKDMVNLYELVKDTYNILAIIDSVPHFSAMLDAYGADSTVLSEYIDTYKLGKKLAKKYIKTELLSQILPRHMSIINGFLNEVMISKFLKTMNNSGIVVNAGDPIFVNGVLTTSSLDKELNFGNPDDIGTFKHIFENKFINQMKQAYPANKFIQDLIWNSYRDSYGNKYEFYQLPLNLDTVDQESNKELFGTYLQHFNNIKEDVFMANGDRQLTIKDIFYLYNLIVNSNKAGRSSLTKIFKDSLKSGEITNSIMFDYFEFLGKMTDKSEVITSRDYDERDLIARLVDYDKEYEGISKRWDAEKGRSQFLENGMTIITNTLNNAVKLPFTMSSYSSVDRLLSLEIRSKLLNLAKLNQLEIKLSCDE